MKDKFKTNQSFEYVEFMQSQYSSVIDSDVVSIISHKLKPSTVRVLAKLIVVSLSSAFLTLLICPQFGIGGFDFGHRLFHWFHGMGELICGVYCASIFFGFATLASGILMNSSEKKRMGEKFLFPILVVPTVLMFAAMISSVILGKFFVMGFGFVAAWYVTGLLIQGGSVYLWRRRLYA